MQMGTGKTSTPKNPSKPPSPLTSYNGGASPPLLASTSGSTPVSVSAENLDLGMDFWNASSGSGPPECAVPLPDTAILNQQALQDERELKRLRRKQSNRESAQRSRLRKQAECEQLQQRVSALSNENLTLKNELQCLWKDCEKLESENTSLKEQLTRLCGSKVVSDFENSISRSPENEGYLDETTS